jgi:hypothetical protein
MCGVLNWWRICKGDCARKKLSFHDVEGGCSED